MRLKETREYAVEQNEELWAKAAENLKNNSIETDIGDRIIQISRMPPTHPTCPAANLDRYEIARIIEHHLKQPVPPNPETITCLMRDEIREKIRDAKIGITGANAVCADEGSIVLIHNEGNILKVATQTEKHIIITSREKIYPNLDEAINMVKVLTFYGTGHITTSYIDVISGPSKTADVDTAPLETASGERATSGVLVWQKPRS